jgi:hypothetical protein
LVAAVPGLGKAFGDVSRCSSNDVGRDVRCPSSAKLLFDCCVGLVIPTCKGLKDSSYELLRPFVSSASIKRKKSIFLNLDLLSSCIISYLLIDTF